jgi:ribonuclease P protein subunit RPR2
MATRRHSNKPEKEKKIARERIETLFVQADEAFKERPALADRYVELARKIAMKFKVRIRPELKRRFCKHCHAFLKPGINCRIRLGEKKVIYYCLGCKRYMRFPFSKRV